MKARIFTLVLALATSVGTLFAESGTCGPSLVWDLTDNILTISGVGQMDNYWSDEYQPWYTEKENISAIVIEKGVTSIGQYAFANLWNLKSVTIPNSVTTIGKESFNNCYQLTSIDIPNSVTSIGSEAFAWCRSLTTITIPNSVTNIGSGVFEYCMSITAPIYNSHVFVFMPTSYSGAYDIPVGIETIAGYAFKNCADLNSVTIPNTVTCIPADAFSFCTGLSSVSIPNSVTSIQPYAFNGCSSLKSIDIPNSVTSIGYHAFAGCSSLSSITIPNSVGSSKPSNYYYWDEESPYVSLFDNDNSLTKPVYNSHIFFYLPQSYVGEYTIPKGIEVVVLSMTYCDKLTAVHVPEGVWFIDGENFYECPNLKEITLPNSITRIGCEKHAFWHSGFYDDKNNWTIVNGVKTLYIGNCLIDVEDFGQQTEWTIREGTTVIADGATKADNYENIKSVKLPESLITIGDFVFSELDIKTITIPDNVRYVGEGAFEACENLTSVAIGSGVEEIGRGAFQMCENLKTLILGSGIKRILPEFIYGCSRLSMIICKATEAPEVYTWDEGYSKIIPMSETDFDTNFSGVSRRARLYVPSEVIQDYEIHPIWGEFNVMPINDADPTNVDQVTISAVTKTSIEIQWPVVSGAATYELIIKDKDDNIICRLIFNENGKLTNITNAPARKNSEQQTQENGFTYTITDLEEGTTYKYSITAKDSSYEVIKEATGSFTTETSTGIENVQNNDVKKTKLLRDGRLFIFRGDRTYTVTGQEVK